MKRCLHQKNKSKADASDGEITIHSVGSHGKGYLGIYTHATGSIPVPEHDIEAHEGQIFGSVCL